MPARTNIFQRLVAEIHQNLGPGWQVSESRLLVDTFTAAREVDVVAQASVGGYPLLMGIEARDGKRPADVRWVEQMSKKHEHLLTNKIVLWSASGFAKSALEKARLLGIDAVAPTAQGQPPWAIMARELVGASVKFVTSKLMPFIYVNLEDGSERQWQVSPETLLNEDSTGQQAPISALMAQFQHDPMFGNTLLDHAPEGAKEFHARYVSPVPCSVICPDGITRLLKLLVFAITTECEVRPVIARSAFHAGRVTTLAEATLMDGTFQLVVEESETGQPRVQAKRRPGKDAKINRKHSK